MGQPQDTWWTVRLPLQWAHGLDDLPGYDADQRVVRLTTQLDVMTDEHDHAVGFLGRAHPLVRRALDRVRNLSFGGTARRGQDPRASAVRADVTESCLLYTFLGRVVSRSGRELERVLAVCVTPRGEVQFFETANQWLPLADPARALRTTDLWETHFASWAEAAQQRAHQAVTAGFQPLAEQFSSSRREALNHERASQNYWLRQRTIDLMGPVGQPAVTQPDLFSSTATPEPVPALPDWQALHDPVVRLAAFHADRTQPPAARVAAEGVLRIYQQRITHLESLADLRPPEIVPLGVLMLIPEGHYGT
jgi:hypothetical protein